MNDNNTREVDITALKERLALIFYKEMSVMIDDIISKELAKELAKLKFQVRLLGEAIEGYSTPLCHYSPLRLSGI